MSMPNIPDITPLITLTRNEVINMLLSSIALEEIGLSHIMNAEGEKIQRMLKFDNITMVELLQVNRSVERMLRTILKNQMMLQFKLEDVIDLAAKDEGPPDEQQEE